MRSDYVPRLPRQSAGAAELARSITSDIRSGRLRAGVRLPGSRSLAERLGVSRSTVVRAYAELVAEGWLASRPGSGMVVVEVEDAPLRHGRTPSGTGFSLPPLPHRTPLQAPVPDCRYRMEGGTPDLRLLPLEELARAYRRVLRGRGRRLVDYGDPAGEPRLRQVLSTWLAETRGLADEPDRLIALRGSQMCLSLVARAVVRPGDKVGVEALGYAPAWGALEAAGARLVGVPVDEDGLRVDLLPDDLRAVYVTPHHQYPTTALMSAPRRMALLRWAAERRVPVLEDDYDHEFHFGGRPVLPLASMDRAGVVVYIGTLSKAFAPGLRLGWVVGPPALVERLAALRRLVDRQGDRVVELAVADLLEDGTIPRHIRRMRREYATRRAHLLGLLEGSPLRPRPTSGGLALWCHSALDPEAWSRAALRKGVFVRTERAFRLDARPGPHLRLGYAGLDTTELTDAIGRLRSVERGVRIHLLH